MGKAYYRCVTIVTVGRELYLQIPGASTASMLSSSLPSAFIPSVLVVSARAIHSVSAETLN